MATPFLRGRRRRPAPTLPGGAAGVGIDHPSRCAAAAPILQYLFLSISIACFLALFGYVGFLFGTWYGYGAAEHAQRLPAEDRLWPPSRRRSLAPPLPRKHNNENSLPDRTLFYAQPNAALDLAVGPPHSAPKRTVTLQSGMASVIGGGGNRTGHPRRGDATFPPLQSVPSPRLITEKWFEPNAATSTDRRSPSRLYDTKVCEPIHPWQLESHLNCNTFHEIDMQQFQFINEGGARVAFATQDGDGSKKVVYKTLKWKGELNPSRVEEQRRDALIMGQASGSRFIPAVHGYCSVAVVMDFMPGGNMHDYIKGSRLAGGSKLPPVDKLRLAIHVSSAVADLHATSYFHNDVCCHQFLLQDGLFKLNDFNCAYPLYANTTSRERCTEREDFEHTSSMWKGRSLEEFQKTVGYANYTPADPETVDIWMMGNLVQTILTDQYPFEKPHLNTKEVARKLVAGGRTPYPERIETSTDPSYVAMKRALDMCWTYNWQERPSARSISEYLIGQLKRITGQEDPDLTVVLPERSSAQRGTDSDFARANCDRHKNGRISRNCIS